MVSRIRTSLPIVRYSVAVICVILAAVLLALPYANGWSQARFASLGGRWEYWSGCAGGELQFILVHDLKSRIAGPIVPMGVSAAYTAFVHRFPSQLEWMGGDFGVESGWQIGTGAGNSNRQVLLKAGVTGLCSRVERGLSPPAMSRPAYGLPQLSGIR